MESFALGIRSFFCSLIYYPLLCIGVIAQLVKKLSFFIVTIVLFITSSWRMYPDQSVFVAWITRLKEDSGVFGGLFQCALFGLVAFIVLLIITSLLGRILSPLSMYAGSSVQKTTRKYTPRGMKKEMERFKKMPYYISYTS